MSATVDMKKNARRAPAQESGLNNKVLSCLALSSVKQTPILEAQVPYAVADPGAQPSTQRPPTQVILYFASKKPLVSALVRAEYKAVQQNQRLSS